MAEEIIDLTKSDEDVVTTGQSNDTDKERPGTRRGGRRGNRRSRNQTQNAAQEAKDGELPQSSEPSNKPTQGERDMPDKEMDSKAKPDPPKSNRTSGSLLSRIGDILHENDKANSRSASGKSKRGSRDRPPAETMAKEGPQAEPRTDPLRSPKEVPLSELPVDQLFFIDTGPSETNRGASVETSPPGTTGSATPDVGPGATSSSAKALKKKLAKERKKEQKQQAEGKVPGDTLNEIEFIGGSALVVDQAIAAATVTRSEGQVVAETVAVTITPDTASETPGLSLPAHVTLWKEGDPDFPLDDAVEALDLEDVEFLDYDGDQACSFCSVSATGIPRYFATDQATAPKKACRTCGEEGHIAKFCKKLICLTCGERDDHDTRNCPMRVVCFNCGGKGHLSSTCPQPRGRPGCDRCGSSKHIEQRCPEQFKTYVYLSEAERLRVLEEREALEDLPFGEGGEGYIARHKWCYNCGNGGHWGDDCKDTRPFSIPTEPCAFGSFNESRGPFGEYDDTPHGSRSAPRPAWMDDDPHLQDVGRRGKEANMRRNRAAEARNIQERDEDDWFSRTAAGSSRNQRSSNDRGSSSKDAPPKPKFSFKPRDDQNGSNRRPSGDHDVARDRNRERRRDNDRDYDRRKRGREYEDERNHRSRDYGDSRRKHDSRDGRDDDRRKRSGGDRRGDSDRYRPQYRGSYA